MKKKNNFQYKVLNGPGDDELFDDCPICQAMKAAKEQGKEPTQEELKEAFKKAKEGGAIVGGEWFK
jgi:DNA-binding protein YbaB